MKRFKHIDAESIKEAGSLLKEEHAVAIAGGTDLLGALKDKIMPEYPQTVVNLKTIDGLDEITEDAEGLSIGAMTKLSSLQDHELVKEKYPSLAKAAKSVASPLIRNSATIGGNICQDVRCWYYRYPHQIGGRVNCVRKGGEGCYAFTGERGNHSIFGAMRVDRPSCSASCPAHVNISAYLARVREHDLDGAAEILMSANPLPAITSRVCTHFCQEGCHRGELDAHVGVGQIERFVGDYILENASRLMPPPKEESGKTVAIVGAGPSGLSAAYYLRKAGHKVTVYDRMEEAGGLLMFAIPAYRLPKAVVRKQIRALEGMGIQFRCGVQVGKDIFVEQLAADYDKVFLSTGAWKKTVIGIDNEDMTRFGLEFLVEVKGWMADKIGANVVVVGGGNVAVDVAVTAKRLGASSVTMVSLESRRELPATKEELERAEEEGITLMPSWGPVAVRKEGGQITGIRLRRCVSVRNAEGRFAPVYDDNELTDVSSDCVLMCVGQQTDLSFLGKEFALEQNRGRIVADGLTQVTSDANVYAGGDVVTGPATVVSALAAGRRAAQAMDHAFSGTRDKVKEIPEGGFLKYDHNCQECKRVIPTHVRPMEERKVDLEDDFGLTPEEVRQEAGRCFNCGCFAVNPSDIANVLVSLDASIVTNIRSYSAEEFFLRTPRVHDILDEGEIVVEIKIPALKSGAKANYEKFRERASIDFAEVACATVYETENNIVKSARIVLGAVAPVPVCCKKAEEYLIGKEISEETADRAAELALAGADPLKETAYKVQVAKTLIKRSLFALR
ncbi:MAG: FAD-dependent oxidoreductase [Eubacteriales bacterium]|nr:FAD-dependent oxidoreductase [Eubacteriales bacterium]